MNINFIDKIMELSQKSFDADKGRGGFDKNYTLPEFIKITLDKLTEDKVYQKEYSDFAKLEYLFCLYAYRRDNSVCERYLLQYKRKKGLNGLTPLFIS